MKFKLFIVFLLAFLGFSSGVFAAVPADLTTAANTLKADGIASITLIGGVMLTLSGLAVLFKWAKAAFWT